MFQPALLLWGRSEAGCAGAELGPEQITDTCLVAKVRDLDDARQEENTVLLTHVPGEAMPSC